MRIRIWRQLDNRLKKEKTTIDRLALFMGIVSPLATLPTAISIWNGNTDGVVVLTWYLFIVVTVSFFIYGLLYRLKALIINEVIWLIMEAIIISGFYINN